MKTPSEQDFQTAIMWLEANNGENGEADSCQAVADWLNQRRIQSDIRSAARKANVPVAKVRQRLKSMGRL